MAQFLETPLVAVAERHRSRQVHKFLLDLLYHPEFPDRGNDIVVEFGSGYYQPIIDRYVTGGDVPHAALQEVWRGTGQWLVCPMGEVAWPPMSDVVDALLYLGSDSSTVDADPATYRDPAYQAELRRRAAILRQVYGVDFVADLEQLLKQGRPR